jgi:hypothetical protein
VPTWLQGVSQGFELWEGRQATRVLLVIRRVHTVGIDRYAEQDPTAQPVA